MNQTTAKPSLPWYRWLTQFSLRSLLILVTLSAIVCWWVLRPESQEEKLADDLLVLRRQVRTIKETPAAAGQPLAGEQGDMFRTIDDGTWQLLDEHRGLIASGVCKADVREGRWTLYHPNGQKAAEGTLLHGARHGLWRVWDAAGHPVSEVTYQAPDHFYPSPPPVPVPYVTKSIPVVGATTLTDGSVLPQFGGGGISGGGFGSGQLSGGFCGTGMLMAQSYTWDRLERERYRSLRHGPCRAWHPATPARRASEGQASPPAPARSVGEGQFSPSMPTRSVSEGPPLAFEGQFDRDQRSGLWTFYDEQGRLVEQGAFIADRREGEWTAIDWTNPDARRRTVRTTFIAGRTQAEHDRLLAGVAADLASGSIRRQVAGITRVEELGQHGWPLLVSLLEGEDLDLKLLALRTFVRQAEVPAEALPKIAPLVDHPDERLAIRAMTALYIAQPEKRNDLFDELLAATAADDHRDLDVETFLAMYRTDAERRAQLVLALIQRQAPQFTHSEGWDIWHPSHYARIAAFGDSVIPHLEAVFQQGDLHERLLVVMILQRVVERGPIERPFVASKTIPRHVIPAAAQPLLQRAKADPEPLVRQAAEAVGTSSAYGGGWGISGGGYF